MASLYIKDRETAELAAEIALHRGRSKTEVVRDALRREKAELIPKLAPENVEQWFADWHRRHPLPPSTGPEADKAFYDSLNEEDDD